MVPVWCFCQVDCPFSFFSMQQFYQQHFVRDADASKCETIPALYSLILYLTKGTGKGRHIHNKDLSLKKRNFHCGQRLQRHHRHSRRRRKGLLYCQKCKDDVTCKGFGTGEITATPPTCSKALFMSNCHSCFRRVCLFIFLRLSARYDFIFTFFITLLFRGTCNPATT